ncbi:uncharacterized protein LOC116595975 isoform X1 [Mustela erminea]|uniref:uncharacterized protein LOC116595975 isoform X1 n=1 Tax=Mustela erminea TaxID=36723 RepID=UPI001386CEE9|nr:uncharacterized protein LOC116595975 isoform X1 [Mustela erminea]
MYPQFVDPKSRHAGIIFGICDILLLICGEIYHPEDFARKSASSHYFLSEHGNSKSLIPKMPLPAAAAFSKAVMLHEGASILFKDGHRLHKEFLTCSEAEQKCSYAENRTSHCSLWPIPLHSEAARHSSVHLTRIKPLRSALLTAQDVWNFLRYSLMVSRSESTLTQMRGNWSLCLNYAGKQSEDYSETKENVRERKKKNPYS